MKLHVALLALVALSPDVSFGQAAPAADHHQHLISPAAAALLSTPAGGPTPITAHDLVVLLDSADIGRALVLSLAYMYGSPARTVEDEYAAVRAENDWTGGQAAQYPDRLRAFCSFNPLRDYALDELARCARAPHLRHGIKLHFGNSDVQLDVPAHVEQLRRIFGAANHHGMAIVVHLRASVSLRRPYGPDQARAFLEQVLPAAADVPVQIAHLAGSGPGEDAAADSALPVFIEAIANGDPPTRNLWFDVTTVVQPGIPAERATLLAERIRQLGIGRVLYGSDAAAGANLRPREGWAAFRRLPLTQEEFTVIANNVAPYLH